MIIWIAIVAILAAFASAYPGLVSLPSDRACWTTNENGETTYVAPLVIDCLPNDTTCGIMEGEYIISLRSSYPKSAHIFYLSSHIPSPALRNTSIGWYSDDEDYIIKNLRHTEMEIIRRDPGIDEVYQHYWFQVDTGWGLQCRNPSLTGEEKRLCYKKLHIQECEGSWLSDEERRECWEESCKWKGYKMTEEQIKTCEEGGRKAYAEQGAL
ncbi:uncharacterized protein M437DRAFT_45271 [Aureobasidium melanogenum CBS 110374]|uniref:Uncharacterized protein n=1 Tax=Aureobasidium melanogenum (strain CBS 110374) TaxID=1043003 RepID=A0A074WNL2_AURM1|nr:uncharacterized protein M437DRAFT_45271 [Aureobasidium melanogenum CBS 110374]KEQ64071.1 hypothetical protein M437DRAFT_45271 [Aureobasidium melanogenum CBS 110374]